MADESISCAEAGRRGGIKVRDEGLVDYAAMGKRGGETTRDRYGPEHYRESGRRGGAATAASRGPKFYAEIGRKGGQRVRELIKRALEDEAAEGAG